LNTLFVTFGVVSISLTIGTLAAYGLARHQHPLGLLDSHPGAYL
jgi:ABC-type glycerol-3-phosphate transport system permease component